MKKPWINLRTIQKTLAVYKRKKRKKRRQRSRLLLNTPPSRVVPGESPPPSGTDFPGLKSEQTLGFPAGGTHSCRAGRDLRAQGLIRAVCPSPAEVKPGTETFCSERLWHCREVHFVCKTKHVISLLPCCPLCLASPGAQQQQSLPGDSQDSWADLQQGDERWAFTAGPGLGSPQIGFFPSSQAGETLRRLNAWKQKSEEMT